MTITLSADLETAVLEYARRQGVSPELLIESIVREKLSQSNAPIEPQDEWEQRLLALATDCGVSLPDSALSREELYDEWPTFWIRTSWCGSPTQPMHNTAQRSTR